MRSSISRHDSRQHRRGVIATSLRGDPSRRSWRSRACEHTAHFEVGIAQLGAHPLTLGTNEIALGTREPIRDAARVLSRYCDAITYRTFTTDRLMEMATYADGARHQCADG